MSIHAAATWRRDRPPRAPAYKLTYETPALFTLIALYVMGAGRPVGVDELARHFEMYPRRVQRYLAGLRFGVFNGDFQPWVLRLEDGKGNEVSADRERVSEIRETKIRRVALVAAPGATP